MTIALLYFLFAAYLAGIGSTVLVFSLILRAADGGHYSLGCFTRLLIALCFGAVVYLVFLGTQVIAVYS